MKKSILFIVILNNLFTSKNLRSCNAVQLSNSSFDKDNESVFNSQDREFVKLNYTSSFEKSRSSEIKQRFISFTAFGQHFNFKLKARDNFLVGKNTPVWHVDVNSENPTKIEYKHLKNIMEDFNEIYQDRENMVSLVESKIQKNGKIYFDGIIADELAISHSERQMEFNDVTNTNDKDHVISKILTTNSVIDIPEITSRKIKKKNPRPYPLENLYPEILVIVDAALYKHFNYQPRLAINYLVPFWNGVDLRYSLLKSPEIKLNIAGIVLAKNDKALPFLHKNFDENGRIHAKEALLDAGKYFNLNSDLLTSKDMVLIMTKRDVCSYKNTKHCKSGTLGKAFTGQACSNHKNVAIFEDNGGYYGIISATHEIGHLLSLPHDGVDEAVDCPPKDGHIMASASFRYNSTLKKNFQWSTCSKKILQQFSSITDSDCLENKPKYFGESLTQTLPGKVLTLEEQCKARGGKLCMEGASVCWKLYCTRSMTNNKCIGKAPAAEGSACGGGFHCRHGECVVETIGNFVSQ